MKTWYVLVPLLVLCSGTLYVKQQRQQRAEIDQLRRQTAALATSIEGDQERASQGLLALSQLSRIAPEPPAPPAAAATPAVENQNSPSQDRPAPKKAPEPAEMAARMDTTFARETADRDWSAKTQEATQEKISALMPSNSAVHSVDCRSTLCRVEMSHESLDDYRKFIQSAYLNGETHVWNGPTFSTVLENSGSGTVVAVSYLIREGQALPSFD